MGAGAYRLSAAADSTTFAMAGGQTFDGGTVINGTAILFGKLDTHPGPRAALTVLPKHGGSPRAIGLQRPCSPEHDS